MIFEVLKKRVELWGGTGPWMARSASDKTDDWPCWYVTEKRDGKINRLRFPDSPGAVFTNREHAEKIAEIANAMPENRSAPMTDKTPEEMRLDRLAEWTRENVPPQPVEMPGCAPPVYVPSVADAMRENRPPVFVSVAMNDARDRAMNNEWASSSAGSVDYESMTGGDMLQALGDNAMKWAEAFCQIKVKNGWTLDQIDESLMVGWFANAIESSHNIRRRLIRAETAERKLAVARNALERCKLASNWIAVIDARDEALEDTK